MSESREAAQKQIDELMQQFAKLTEEAEVIRAKMAAMWRDIEQRVRKLGEMQ